MPKYFYIARDKTGNKVRDAEVANSVEEVARRLQAKELYVVSILPEEKSEEKTLKTEVVKKINFKPGHYRITSEDLALFCRQLSTLLSAGVTILKSLDIISQQVTSRKLFNVIKDIQKNMEQGLSLHEAMAKHVGIFSELWVNLAESGEASGNLAVVLNRLATYLERNAAFKKKIISALIYPAMLLIAGTGALLFLTLKIIPVFAELFEGFNVPLPFITKLLIATSVFIRKRALLGIGVIAIGFFFFKKYTATRIGRMNYERLKFTLPLVGDFYRALVVERFTSEMSTLVESGVPILYSLEITEHSVGNLVLGEIIHKTKEEVRQGKPLSIPLERSGFFEPMAVQMITIGEEIGELASMFKRLNDFYQEAVDVFLTRFTTMFEPIIMVFLGGIVGVMVLGVFLPIFQLAKVSGG